MRRAEGFDTPPGALRERLLDRAARSATASRALLTVRRQTATAQPLAPGVVARTLYRACGPSRRQGEPASMQILTLAAGSCWTPPAAPGMRREWLLIAGRASLGKQVLAARDHAVLGDGAGDQPLVGLSAATLLLREAQDDSLAGPMLVAPEGPERWHDFGPGIRRRILWQQGGEAAMLYRAAPGAVVPQHRHGRDEECLMLEGEVFLDDLLLRCGDYQLAPAGTGHAGVSTATGGLLYAHGDLELDFH